MRQIRLAYPRSTRLHWIQDNLSYHWTPAIRAWAQDNNVELVPTPTYASHLNRIESHFGAIGEFVVKNADYLDWDSFALTLANHITHRKQPRPPPATTPASPDTAAPGRLSHDPVSAATLRETALVGLC
jgi:transposase